MFRACIPWSIVILVFASLSPHICEGQGLCFMQGSRLQSSQVCGPWKRQLIDNRHNLAQASCPAAASIVESLNQPNQVCCEAAAQFVSGNCLCDPVTATAVMVAGYNPQELYAAGLKWFQYGSCAAFGAANTHNPCSNVVGCLQSK
eukprot:jgi/Botrbrau1/257/Bobra.0022s0228.1